jgi:polysaccharide chain length determinant protein (PEP-CTERM system associated)
VIPGKKYTPDDLIDIAKRRKWLIVVPFLIVASGAVVVSRRTPNLYRSETLILVVPQRISESYVRSTVIGRIEDRLQSITQQILSRTRLEQIILEFNLYGDARKKGAMEDIVDGMRKQINVETVKGDAFRVSFVSGDPQAAMKVTNRLASLFIEENLRDRAMLAEDTNQFLESQLQDARKRLAEREKKVEEYRRRYSGELPSQVESNLQVIQNTQSQVQALVQSIDRDRDRRLVLERSIAEAASNPRIDVASTIEAAPVKSGVTPADQLEAARSDLQALEARLKPEHPDVGAARRKVRDLEARLAAEPTPSPAPVARPSSASAPSQPRLRGLEAEMQNLDRQIAAKEKEETRLRGVMATYQARVEAAPTRESEMIEITRDYNTLQQVYANLLTKGEDSKVSANLERRQNGEQFRILDPARVPESPFSPDRVRINVMGALGGLALGLGFAALLEYRDTSLRTDEDVVTSISLPVLAMIPLITTTVDDRRGAFVRRVAALAAAAVAFGGVVALAWKLAR